MSVYRLRVLLWSWGLMVDVDLSVSESPTQGARVIAVAEGVWLSLDPAVNALTEDVEFLCRGVRRVASRLRAKYHIENGPVVVNVGSLWYPLTDCQDEALELAVVEWAAQLLGIADSVAQVVFDHAANRYRIDFNEALWDGEPQV